IVTGEAVEIRYAIPIGPEGEREPFCRLRTDYQVRLPDPRRQRNRKGRAQAQAAPERVDRILRETGTLHGGDGGLWCRASLGAHSQWPWSHGEADCRRSGQPVRQEGQEE